MVYTARTTSSPAVYTMATCQAFWAYFTCWNTIPKLRCEAAKLPAQTTITATGRPHNHRVNRTASRSLSKQSWPLAAPCSLIQSRSNWSPTETETLIAYCMSCGWGDCLLECRGMKSILHTRDWWLGLPLSTLSIATRWLTEHVRG